jgi:hypothetical protein
MDVLDDSRRRQFFWGLSNGIVVLALATAFWFGIAAAFAPRAWIVPVTVLSGVSTLALLYGAVRVRRKAGGFGIADLKRAEGSRREEIRGMRVCFLWAAVAETLAVSIGVGLAMHYHRQDQVWPAIGLGVSLHFAPLAWVFRVRVYYATALVGSAICLAALLTPAAVLGADARTVFLGLAMGICVSGTAGFAVLRADRMAAAWDEPP